VTALTIHEPAQSGLATTSAPDPTGGRLVAWAEAASAANQLAKALATTAFVPQAMRNPGDATAAILMGDELGLSPLAALRSIYVVHGTPALYARSMVALAQSHGHEIWTEESSDAKVVVCGRRRGSEKVERSEWTIQRAQKAGYTSNKKYASNPQEMLYSKAAGEVARKIAADTLAGIPYSVEDIELGEQPTVTVQREPVKRTVARKAKVAAPAPRANTDPDPIDVTDAEVLPDEEPEGDVLTDRTRGRMFALFAEQGIEDPDVQRSGMSSILGRAVASRSSLTEAEAREVIASLEARQS